MTNNKNNYKYNNNNVENKKNKIDYANNHDI